MPAVTIDLWHTLIYLKPDAEETYMAEQIAIGSRVLREARRLPGGREFSDEELGKAFERRYAAAVMASTRGRTVTPAEQIIEAARETRRDVDPRDYLRGLEELVERTPFHRAPGALGLLRELRGRGYRLGVISNTVGEPGEFLRPVLSSMGLDRLVETFVFSDEHPWAKPSPKIFRYALGQLDERPSDAVHVGDGWADVEGARRAAYRGAILFTGLHHYSAQYRKLFLAGFPEGPRATYRTDRLSAVGPMVDKLLPLSRSP